MRAVSYGGKKLQFEWLEQRELLAATGKYYDGAGGLKNWVTDTVYGPTQDDATTKVHLTVGMPAFQDVAVTSGSLAIPAGQESSSIELSQGQTANFSISLKSLDEYYSQWSGFQQTNEKYLLYFTRVKLTITKLVPGFQADVEEREWLLARFITALDPTAYGGQATPGWSPDTIFFESTAFDFRHPFAGSLNEKTLQVIAPSRYSPILKIEGTTAGQVAAFANAGGTNGNNAIRFSPQSGNFPLVQGKIDIQRQLQTVGTIKLLGKVITPRKWWIDIPEFAAGLEKRFINAYELKSQDPSYFLTLANDIVYDVQHNYSNFWGTFAIGPGQGATASNATIDVELTPTSGAQNAHTSLAPTSFNDFFRKLGTLKYTAGEVNTITTSYLLGEALDELRAGNQKITIHSGKFPVYIERDVARRVWAKTLAHELGHAHLFVGHMIPSALPEDNDAEYHSYFDLMQQGSGLPGVPFNIIDSAPYLRLATGRSWWDSSLVEAALAKIKLDGQLVAPGQRVHNLYEADEGDWPWIWIDDEVVTESQQAASFLIRLSYPTDHDVTVRFVAQQCPSNAPAPGCAHPATAGADFTPVSGVATIPAGQVSTTVAVPVNQDFQSEHNEKFLVTLSQASYGVIDDGVATGTIVDDDRILYSADFDQDGTTTGLDFLTWQRSAGKQNVTFTDGDSNGDGHVDGDDLLQWQYGMEQNAVANSLSESNTLASHQAALAAVLAAWSLDRKTSPQSAGTLPAGLASDKENLFLSDPITAFDPALENQPSSNLPQEDLSSEKFSDDPFTKEQATDFAFNELAVLNSALTKLV